MPTIVIKLVDKNKPIEKAQAEGELEGAGFKIVYNDSADMIGVDAVKHGDGEETYSAGYVIIGKK